MSNLMKLIALVDLSEFVFSFLFFTFYFSSLQKIIQDVNFRFSVFV